MTNAKNRKLLAVLLALALLSLSVMALGGTFASQLEWTDPTPTMSPTHYKVSVKCHDGQGYNTDLLSGTPVLTKQTIWCPGRTEILYLKVENSESFLVECILDLVVGNNDFDNMIEYAVISNMQYGNNTNTNWQDFKENATTKNTLQENKTYNIFHFPTTAPLTGTHYYALAIHMSEDANDDYQNAAMQLSFNLRINANEKGTAATN